MPDTVDVEFRYQPRYCALLQPFFIGERVKHFTIY